jgi:hypothetical protein
MSLPICFLRKCPRTLNDDIPGLDGDLDPLGDVEQFLGVAVPNVSPYSSKSLIRVRCGQADFGRVCGACFRECASWEAATEQSPSWIDVHVLHLGMCCGLVLVD